jgi:hypothetical protein
MSDDAAGNVAEISPPAGAAASAAAGDVDAPAGEGKNENNSSSNSNGDVIPGAKVERKSSALRENIKEKGQYSYYYGHTLDTPEVRAEREAALRLQEAANKGGVRPSVTTTVVTQRLKIPISQYSWSDGKKSVTMYVNVWWCLVRMRPASFFAASTVRATVRGRPCVLVLRVTACHSCLRLCWC